MSGEELKRIITTVDIPQAQIAEMLGIFPQSFHTLLKSKDVKSGMIESLCRILNNDITFFYPAYAHARNSTSENVLPVKDNTQLVRTFEEQIAELQRQIQGLQRDKEDLRAYIRVLEQQNASHG